jgi:hypothetical protein
MDCYKCKYRGTVPGSAHSSCNHPTVLVSYSSDPSTGHFMMMLKMLRGYECSAKDSLGIKLNDHGILNGWANFPVDFDPVWVEECHGFVSNE